ncbi:MAG: discoidin domain-containing protein, partial [Phycisphaeraceae bacterium]
ISDGRASRQAPVESVIDGTGFTQAEKDLLDTGDPVPSPYPNHSNTTGDNWRVVDDDSILMTFDLGDTFLLDGFHVWNFNESGQTGRGAKSVDVSFSTDGTNFSSAANFTFVEATGATTYTGEDYSLNATTSARWVRFDIQNSHNDPDRVGLSEVRFLAIPEPASVALIGLGGIMLLARRRW